MTEGLPLLKHDEPKEMGIGKEKVFFILKTSHESQAHITVALKSCSTQKRPFLLIRQVSSLIPRKMELFLLE